VQAGPSKTAWRVAVRRAAHQILDHPRVLDDPIALQIIGEEAAAAIRAAPWKHQTRFSRASRAFLVARSRFAEDELARAVERGVTQYVILGAGLDTFAYRNPFSTERLRVFEVDHPATQAWKRERLTTSSIPVPPSVTFAPIDFERQTLASGLAAAGFDFHRSAFFSWLGVTWYLTDAAIQSTLAFVASTMPGGGLVFDYGVSREAQGVIGRLAYEAIATRVALAGEPFQSLFDPAQLRARLEAAGFSQLIDVGRDELNDRYFRDRADELRVPGTVGRIVSGVVDASHTDTKSSSQ